MLVSVALTRFARSSRIFSPPFDHSFQLARDETHDRAYRREDRTLQGARRAIYDIDDLYEAARVAGI